MISGFHSFPVFRKVFEEILKDGFCVIRIALKELIEEGGVKVFVKDEWGSDFLHICNLFVRYALSTYVLFSTGCAPNKTGSDLTQTGKTANLLFKNPYCHEKF